MPDPKPTIVGPLTGVLDLRSQPDALAQGSVRMRQNFQCTGRGKLRRGCGWSKLMSVPGYNNPDFHDQLLSLSGGTRAPITLMYQAESTRKQRSLIIANQNTVAQLNSHSGNYRIMGSGFGGTPGTSANAPRFKAAIQGDFMLLTNDFNPVQYLVLEQAADPITGAYMATIPDLAVIGLTRAKVIWQWKNVIFLANVEMDADRFAYRIVWGDFDNPLSFDPANLASIAGDKDLFTYEEILGGAPLGDSFLIYTTHNIWEMIAVGGDQSFDFRRIYNGEKNELKGLLAYPNTLCALPDAHTYMAKDGIYFFSKWAPQPDRPEWLYASTEDIYDNIDDSSCQAHIACPFGDEVYYSVALKGDPNALPSYTLRVNKTYQVSDVVDAGFSAMIQFAPQDTETIRDFIIQNRICTVPGLAAQGYPYGKEGLPRTLPVPTAPFDPEDFYTNITQRIPITTYYYVTVEDWNQYYASDYSLCNLLGQEQIDELCRKCEPVPILVAAHSVDWCLKQIGGVFYRETCQNPTATGITDSNGYNASIGSYTLDQYTSILRFAPAFMQNELINLHWLAMNFLAQPQAPPLGIALRIGVSGQPADPNTGVGMVWYQHSSKPLAYESARNQAQHLAANTQPTARALWNLFREGRYLYAEFTIAGVGGDAIFSSVEADLSRRGVTRNY